MGLTAAELKQFHEQGYLVKSQVLNDDILIPMREAIAEMVDTHANRLAAEGLLENTHADVPFPRRLAKIFADDCKAAAEIIGAIQGRGGGGYTGSAILNALHCDSLVNCVSSIVGQDIIGSAVYRIRPKAPQLTRGEVPWHQDSGYLLRHCDRHMIVTCWVPLVDATLENGCLHVIPGVHRRGIMEHCTGGHAGYLEIPSSELPEVEPVPVEMKAGDVLFLTNLTPHASFANSSDHVRWSIDLRYQGAETPNNVDEEPESYTPEREPVTMACYPAEADFVIRDSASPEREVRDVETFQAIRSRYEQGRAYSPGRGWQPLSERLVATDS